jgi:hypothetical protein
LSGSGRRLSRTRDVTRSAAIPADPVLRATRGERRPPRARRDSAPSTSPVGLAVAVRLTQP